MKQKENNKTQNRVSYVLNGEHLLNMTYGTSCRFNQTFIPESVRLLNQQDIQDKCLQEGLLDFCIRGRLYLNVKPMYRLYVVSCVCALENSCIVCETEQLIVSHIIPNCIILQHIIYYSRMALHKAKSVIQMHYLCQSFQCFKFILETIIIINLFITFH